MITRGILKEHATAIDYLSRFCDPALATLCTLAFIRLCFDNSSSLSLLRFLPIFTPVVIMLIFPMFNLYKSWRGLSVWKEMYTVFFAWATTLLSLIILIMFVSTEEELNSLRLATGSESFRFLEWAGAVFLSIVLFRLFLRLFLRAIRAKGFNRRHVVIVGAGVVGRRVCEVLLLNSWMGYQPIAFFEDDISKVGKSINGVKVIGPLNEIGRYLRENEIDCIFITLALRHAERIREILHELEDFTGDVKMVPDMFGYFLLNSSMSEIAKLPVINLRDGLSSPARVLKWIEDKVVALVGLAILSPLMCAIAVAVKISSPGPVFFRQARYGINGKKITIYKFRTMTVCEDGPDIPQAKKNDPRVTRLGAFLRRTSLDELPQFINVLQGRMSVVGPRPHAVVHNEFYRKQVPHYMLRHKIKPGITGWAQVNGWRGETETIEKMQKRVEHDLEYINNWSLSYDLKVIFLTLFKGFRNPNAY